MQAILLPEVKLWLYLSAACETQSNQRWLWRPCPIWKQRWPCSREGMEEERMAITPLLTLNTAPGQRTGTEEPNTFIGEEMSYFTGKSGAKRHWKVEAPCYSGAWHGSSWSFPEWSYPENAGLYVSCPGLILQSLSWLALWVPREVLLVASESSRIYHMYWFYKMLLQVQILILLLIQDKFV